MTIKYTQIIGQKLLSWITNNHPLNIIDLPKKDHDAVNANRFPSCLWCVQAAPWLEIDSGPFQFLY